MKIGKIIGCIGVGALCVATGGLAAPAIGAASTGIAALGGASLAVGGFGMAGGTTLIQAVASGVGFSIASNVADGAKLKKQNKELREELKQANMDSATKQKVIENLNVQISKLRQALADEKAKSQRNEEKIKVIQEQLDDLLETLSTAQAA